MAPTDSSTQSLNRWGYMLAILTTNAFYVELTRTWDRQNTVFSSLKYWMDTVDTATVTGGTNALEVINLSLLQEIPGSWIENKKRVDMNFERSLDQNEEYVENIDNDKENTPFITFQRTMKLLLINGQCVGLNPVTAILNHDITKIRFKFYSWRFIYTVIIATVQTFVAVVSVYKNLASGVSIKSLVYWCLSLASLCTTIIFIRIASKWHMLVNEILNCNLDKYMNKGISFQCNVYSIVFLILAIVEYVLYSMWEISEVLECVEIIDYNTVEIIVWNMDPAVFEIGIPYNIPTAIVLQVNNIFTSANWTFSDIYIICISLYLTSILNEINKKIQWVANKNYLSASIWGTLRDDYNRATRLIRRFDDVFSGLILLSFATNLFWICAQIFNVLDNGIRPTYKSLEICPHPHNTPFHGYERSIYVVFSLIFLIVRFTTMCLVTASVNAASSVPASGLYRVPSCAYSMEVQRFLDQVHDDVVALTGMKYFHITRELVLSMAGTILTYELVLLQLSSEELNDS